MSTRHENVLDAAKSVILVIDVQEKFKPAIRGFDAMLAGCVRLVRTARALEVPVLVTEQYPRGLGRTVDEIQSVLPEGAAPEEKTAFSSLGCVAVAERLANLGRSQVLVCGIETHVCVSQTVHDLLAAGHRTHVAIDAVASRHASDHNAALRRLEHAGAILTTTEMAAFELLVDARHEKFREVQALFK